MLEVRAVERCVRQIGAGEERLFEVRATQIRIGEVRAFEDRLFEVRAVEPRAAEVGARERRFFQVAMTEHRAGHPGAVEARAFEVGAPEIGVLEHRAREIHALAHRFAERLAELARPRGREEEVAFIVANVDRHRFAQGSAAAIDPAMSGPDERFGRFATQRQRRLPPMHMPRLSSFSMSRGRPPREPASPSALAPALMRWAIARGVDVATRAGLEPADAERDEVAVTARTARDDARGASPTPPVSRTSRSSLAGDAAVSSLRRRRARGARRADATRCARSPLRGLRRSSFRASKRPCRVHRTKRSCSTRRSPAHREGSGTTSTSTCSRPRSGIAGAAAPT